MGKRGPLNNIEDFSPEELRLRASPKSKEVLDAYRTANLGRTERFHRSPEKMRERCLLDAVKQYDIELTKFENEVESRLFELDPPPDPRADLVLRAQARLRSQVLQARENPSKFIEYVFTDPVTGKGLVQQPFHEELMTFISNPLVKNKVVLMPRDHGKTTQAEAYILWRIGNNPNLRIKIVCESDSRAVERLFSLIQHIRSNERLKDVFPHLKPAELGDWCVPVDSLVQMADGTRRRVDAIIPGDCVIGWSATERKTRPARVEAVTPVILKPCVRVTARSNRNFCASVDHGMLSYGEKYVRAGDLDVGDPVAFGRGFATESDIGTPGEARLLGYLVGDGYVATKAGGPWFTNGDDEIISDFIQCVEAMGWACRLYADRGTYKMLGVVRGADCLVDAREWLSAHGLLAKTSRDKFVPESIFRGIQAMTNFLGAYFCCDGCLDRQTDRVSLTTVSEVLATDTMALISALGASPRLTRGPQSGAMRIGCAGWDGVDFAHHLARGMPACRKKTDLVAWITDYTSSHDVSVRRSDLWHEPGGAWNGGAWRRRLSDDPATLGWDRVKSVQPLGILPCVDLTIEQPVDTFLLDDGFVAHNTKHKIVVKRDHIMRDASVEALGVLSTATGGRADLLLADDVVGRRNSIEQPKLRETVKSAWDSDWSNLLEPQGESIWISTPWHVQDCTHKLIANPAYHVFRRPVGTETDPLAPLWPEKWSREALAARRAKIGEMEFNRGFRLIALSGEFALVPPNWITYWEEQPNVETLFIFIAFDVSSGESRDFFSAVVLGVHPTDARIFVLEAWHAKLTFLARADAIVRMHARWLPNMMGVEQETMKSLGQYLSSTTLLNIVALRPTLPKAVRLLAVTPYLQRGQVIFNPILRPSSIGDRESHGDLVTELLDFPLGANDDLVDAFVHAMALATTYGISQADDGLDLGVDVVGSGGTTPRLPAFEGYDE